MTPPLPSAKMSTMPVAQEDLDKAMRHVKSLSEKQLKSKKASWQAFMKINPDPAGKAAKGKDQWENIAKFHMHQVKAQNSQKKAQTEKTFTKRKEKIGVIRWMSEEQMNIVLGPDKGEHWRDSGKLVCRPDRVTKSTLKRFIEHACPDDSEKVTEADLDLLRAHAEADMTPEDFETMAMAFGATSSASGSKDVAAAAAIEWSPPEPTQTPEEIMAEKIAWLLEDVPNQHQRYLDMVTWAKIVQTKALTMHEKQRHLEPLKHDLAFIISKGTRLAGLLEQMQTDTVCSDKMPKVIVLKGQVDERKCDAEEAAARWNIEGGSPVAAAKGIKRRRKENVVE